MVLLESPTKRLWVLNKYHYVNNNGNYKNPINVKGFIYPLMGFNNGNYIIPIQKPINGIGGNFPVSSIVNTTQHPVLSAAARQLCKHRSQEPNFFRSVPSKYHIMWSAFLGF